MSFEAPADRETLREARILEALNRKLPKLNAARGPNGLSVLVVETGDLSLANQWLISEAGAPWAKDHRVALAATR